MSEPFRMIWFDPGLTTGWAEFKNGTPTRMGTLQYGRELFSFLDLMVELEIYDLIGYENYRLRPKGHDRGYEATWSEVTTVRVIGAIEYAAYRSGEMQQKAQELRSQEPDVKHAGYGYANLGKYDPDKPGMHMQDAIAHGAFYWMEVHCAVRSSPSAQRGRLPRYSPTRNVRPRRRT